MVQVAAAALACSVSASLALALMHAATARPRHGSCQALITLTSLCMPAWRLSCMPRSRSCSFGWDKGSPYSCRPQFRYTSIPRREGESGASVSPETFPSCSKSLSPCCGSSTSFPHDILRAEGGNKQNICCIRVCSSRRTHILIRHLATYHTAKIQIQFGVYQYIY